MPDQATIDSVATKFESWAQTLPPDEQSTLAAWLATAGDKDVSAHWEREWWQEPGGWSRAWTDTWTT